MGDSSAAHDGEAFIKEFVDDYRRAADLDGARLYVVVKHGLVYDDFNREVKYGVTLRPSHASEPGQGLDVVLDEPAAYDAQAQDPVGEMIRVARDLGLPRGEVLARFERAGLVEEGMLTLADFPPEGD